MNIKSLRIKQILSLSLVVVAAAVAIKCSTGKSEENDTTNKPLALPIYTVDTSDAVTVRDYLGTIEGKVTVDVRPQIEGMLREIYVDEGQFVQKGQKMFKIDASAFQEELNNAVATQNVAKAKLENAQLEIDRLKPLVENDVISEVRLRSAKSDYDVAKASLAQATAAVGSAQINKEFTLITAPVTGYISRIPKRIGNLVTKGDKEPLTMLSDVQEVFVYFSMNESDFLYFSKQKSKEDSINGIKRENQLSFPEATLILADGEAYKKRGKVDAINGQVDRSTGAISLRASFENTDNILRSGSTGTLKISEVKKGVIQIPQIATSELQDRTFVYVLTEDNKAERRSITINGTSKDKYIVASGLEIGDRVLISGLDKITDGSSITPIQQ